MTALLALIGAWLAHRRPRALRNVHTAVRSHPLVSLTVGALVTVTFLALSVFMAFTLVLLPIGLLGLAIGLAAAGYGVVCLGSLVARWLPVRRAAPATALGEVAVMVALQALNAIPVLGTFAAGSLVLTGLGAVVVTYFGLTEFTPVALPE
ncbi:hypothetical protein [Haloechinothrix salitolerans]|uniref:DUF8173 domain-containing protein n=1 Tax=Haloechinothrix salitolerans TaxID=926830 RepID=A0ABW2BUX7_9PSEU